MNKISLSQSEREQIKSTIDLKKYGFILNKDGTYKDKNFFRVFMGTWQVVFSAGHCTHSVDYDKLDEFLVKKGYSSQK